MIRILAVLCMSGALVACGGGSGGSGEPASLTPQNDTPASGQDTEAASRLSLVGDWVACINVDSTGESIRDAYFIERFTYSRTNTLYASSGCTGRIKVDTPFESGTYTVGTQTVDSSGVAVFPIDYEISSIFGRPADSVEFGLVSVPVDGQIFFESGPTAMTPADRSDSLNFNTAYIRQ